SLSYTEAKRSKPSGQPPSSCTTGPVQCCNQVKEPTDSSLTGILGLLGIVVGDLTGLVGVGCSPITGVGVGGGTCSSHTVCCENNSVGGLISIGCIPSASLSVIFGMNAR
ncbi:fungal hydrophobin-domain-containing protein, partial [Daedaleopsis nitida]